MGNLLKQIEGLDEKEEYQKIIDLVGVLEDIDKTYDVQSELGRAFNNLANNTKNIEEKIEYLNKAIDVFKSIEEEEKRDKRLYYRLAYSYWALGKYFDALEEVEKSLSIDPEYDNAIEIYPEIIEDISSPFQRYNTCERVHDFWKKFVQEEEKIREAVDSSANAKSSNESKEDLSNSIGDVLKIVFEDPTFEIGFYTELNKYEVILPIDGYLYRIYIRQYLLSKMPESIKENWIFTIGRRRSKDIDRLAMQRYDTTIIAGSIKLIPSVGEDNKIDIKVYQTELSEMFKENENQAYNILFPLLDTAIGEIITIKYIGTIDIILDEPTKESITLGDLYDYILENLEDVRENIESYTVYKAEAKEGDCNYREDVYIGMTSCNDIISAYYDNDISIIKEFYQDTGAILGYFYFDNGKINKDEIVDVRGGIEEAILEKASDFGTIIGGATGHSYCYIDFIAYDSEKFIEISREILKTLGSEDIGFSVLYPQAIKYTL